MPSTLRGDAVFVPADPPRSGVLALWGPDSDDGGLGEPGRVELVVQAGRGIRRRAQPARLVPVDRVWSPLVSGPTGGPTGGAPAHPMPTPSLAAWAAAATVGSTLIARGRLLPTVSAGGHDAWRVGPLDPADLATLRRLAAAFPPIAHALPHGNLRPVRIRSAEALIRAFWDAMADALVRSPAAARTVAHPSFAAPAATSVPELAGWLTEAAAGLDAGARAGLRLVAPGGDGERFRAVIQLRSVADPSLVVDAADLWDAPGVVLARLGERAETDLLLALRRGARAWPPLAGVLRAATPTGLEFTDDEVEQLLGPAAEALGGAGIEVLWPADLLDDGLRLRATVGTPKPAGVTEAVFTLDKLLEFRWQLTLDGEPLTEEEMVLLAEAKRPLIRLRGRWIRVEPDLLERLRRRRSRPVRAVEALAAALAGTIEIDGDPVEFVPEGPLADLVERLKDAARRREQVAGEQPPGLEATLRPYQRRGLAWLAEMCELGLGGCLADDMGLGKTLQTIALHLYRHRGPSGPTLVVCPTSLLGNWEREVQRFAPAVPVRRYHGGLRHLDEVADDEIVLVTYGVLRRDRAALAEVPWGLVVADEAQHAKNPLSRTARELRAVPSAARIALTGTPVENRLTELWSVLDWTTPGLLGPLETFRRQVALPVERYRDPGATERLARVVRPFLLRRRKSDPGIAPELPPKTETDRLVPLTPEQATLYEAVVRETLAAISQAAGIDRRGLVLKLLTALKQICNHPAQYLKESSPLPGRSGKLAALDELTEVIVDEGERVLVFTQYVEMARLVQRHLDARGVHSLFLHGGVPARQREGMVARFQAGEAPVFLLSLKAGGTGLNLTRATHVVHYDRWWNPAVEDQATDRAYRIGQDRPVQVHRLIAEGTVEDRIATLLESKRELANAVVGSGEGWITELSDGELADLVALRSPA